MYSDTGNLRHFSKQKCNPLSTKKLVFCFIYLYISPYILDYAYKNSGNNHTKMQKCLNLESRTAWGHTGADFVSFSLPMMCLI